MTVDFRWRRRFSNSGARFSSSRISSTMPSEFGRGSRDRHFGHSTTVFSRDSAKMWSHSRHSRRSCTASVAELAVEHVAVDQPDVEVGEPGSFVLLVGRDVLLVGRDRAAEHGLEYERRAETGRYC